MRKNVATMSRRKQPRTFSLSEDVIEVLERYKRESGAESLTSALEEMVREWKKQRLSAMVTSYYDALSDEEVAQEKQWGAFSESQM
jgi:predicted CopG family antitoxin